MEKKGALSGDEGNAVDDTEGGDMEQRGGRGALPPSAPTPIDTYFTPEEKGGLEVWGVPAISPMALPCCVCARKATRGLGSGLVVAKGGLVVAG